MPSFYVILYYSILHFDMAHKMDCKTSFVGLLAFLVIFHLFYKLMALAIMFIVAKEITSKIYQLPK